MWKGSLDGGLVLVTTQPMMSRVIAPPPPKPMHRERTITPTVPLETAVESSSRPIGMGPTATIGGGGSETAFMLKNLQAPGNFFWD